MDLHRSDLLRRHGHHAAGVRAPDGRIFIWTKGGAVSLFKNGVLLPTPFIEISATVNSAGDRELLGLAIDPNYATNGYVYLLYAHEEGTDPQSTGEKVSVLTRVAINPANADVALAKSETAILDSTAVVPCPGAAPTVNCPPSNGPSHSIGTVRFGLDGKRCVGNGLSGNGHAATLQNRTTWAAGRYGSALRLDGVDNVVSIAQPRLRR